MCTFCFCMNRVGKKNRPYKFCYCMKKVSKKIDCIKITVYILLPWEKWAYKQWRYKFCYCIKSECINFDHIKSVRIKNDRINFVTYKKWPYEKCNWSILACWDVGYFLRIEFRPILFMPGERFGDFSHVDNGRYFTYLVEVWWLPTSGILADIILAWWGVWWLPTSWIPADIIVALWEVWWLSTNGIRANIILA